MTGQLASSLALNEQVGAVGESSAVAPTPATLISGVREIGSDPADEAMRRYASGEEAAFREVYRLLAPQLRGFLRRLCGSQELAEDLTQETLLKVHGARGSFEPGRRVKPWAYAIARNCYVSHARAGRNRLLGSSLALEDCSPRSLDPSGEETTIARQTAQIVERTLAAMTDARREAFILLRYEGLSVAAAAEIVGTTEGALKIRAFHAYEAIRKALDADSSDGPAFAGEGNPSEGHETKVQPLRTSHSSGAKTGRRVP